MSLSRLAATLVFLLTALTVTTASATTLQLLRNGGFEQGKSGWTGVGLSSANCPSRSGTGALAIVSTGSVASAEQNIRGPLGDGSCSFIGFLMVASGLPQIEVILTWLDSGSIEIDRESRVFVGGTSYGSFSLRSSRPAAAESPERPRTGRCRRDRNRLRRRPESRRATATAAQCNANRHTVTSSNAHQYTGRHGNHKTHVDSETNIHASAHHHRATRHCNTDRSHAAGPHSFAYADQTASHRTRERQTSLSTDPVLSTLRRWPCRHWRTNTGSSET